MRKLSHVDADGGIRMVDTSGKGANLRRAIAEGFVKMPEQHLSALDNLPKGDLLTTAQIAGIAGAKRTSELIPLCHSLPLDHVSVTLSKEKAGIRVTSVAKTESKTGVEMEALVAVTIAALTVYDMAKAIGPGIEITDIRLLEKTGGKKDWKRTE
jgi:cyclic pyranopterin phosphate synthase